MRLIDADELLTKLDRLEAVKGNAIYRKALNDALHDFFPQIIADMPTLATPPNDLLTLEELRKMEGEPVYYIGCNGEHEWLIFRKLAEYTGIKMAFFNDRKSKAQADYGTMWTVYRRKPEEVQE